MKTLLVGGHGFIGEHLSNLLLSRDHQVTCISRHSPPQTADNRVVQVMGSYADRELLRNALKGIQSVVHLAHESIQLNQTCDMRLEYERNVLPAIQLMEECLHAGVEKFIFVSSGGTVYGNSLEHRPIRECSPTSPISLYGTSKLNIEQIARLYFQQRGLPAVIVRPGNAYGPGQIPFKGQGIVATTLASVLQRRPIPVFGSGGSVRDYVHVDDIAQAIATLIHTAPNGEIFNIGTGVGVATIDLLNRYLRPLVENDGHELLIKREAPRPMDVGYNVLDIEKLTRQIDYSPMALQEGLPATWEWIKTYLSKQK
ncbi:NAD-dependent epimerase/dehydratase family protein [Pseudomonas sp. Pseusp97]|uniref:NAD-dependent epimerase/dehydratase family protein n=1 Tax=Pseudomonas sp. Pseusp97 TaxID=3243065 RepID=UPI0039A72E76